jgi:hypothetical protein
VRQHKQAVNSGQWAAYEWACGQEATAERREAAPCATFRVVAGAAVACVLRISRCTYPGHRYRCLEECWVRRLPIGYQHSRSQRLRPFSPLYIAGLLFNVCVFCSPHQHLPFSFAFLAFLPPRFVYDACVFVYRFAFMVALPRLNARFLARSSASWCYIVFFSFIAELSFSIHSDRRYVAFSALRFSLSGTPLQRFAVFAFNAVASSASTVLRSPFLPRNASWICVSSWKCCSSIHLHCSVCCHFLYFPARSCVLEICTISVQYIGVPVLMFLWSICCSFCILILVVLFIFLLDLPAYLIPFHTITISISTYAY